MPTVTTKTARKRAKPKKASRDDIPEPPEGSIVAELLAISRSIPAEEWAKVPRDLFFNLDHYLYGAPKKKLYGAPKK